MIVAVNEIAKKPKLLSDIEDIIYIKDKRKNLIKSIVIPAKYFDLISEDIKNIEYEIWKEKNKKALSKDFKNNEIINDLGDKID